MVRTKSPDRDVFIIDGLRTPIGNPYMGFKDLGAVELASCVIKEVVRRNKVDPKRVGEVILGNVVSAGMGQNFARQAAILGKLPPQILSYSVNSVCGAGLYSVILGAQSILVNGGTGLVIAGGAESATHCPYFVKRREAENIEEGKAPELNPVDCLQHDGLSCRITGRRMGDLVEEIARKFKISREEQDDFAFESHRRACLAQRNNDFKNEVVAVKAPHKRVVKDEHPRQNLDRAWLERLPPVFWTSGTVTAGNSSLSCDGAAAVLLASPEAARQCRLKPLARIAGYVSVAIDPQRSFEAMPEAVEVCLHKCGFQLKDIDLFELSEAFAAQIILTQKKLHIPPERVNIFGGDIALGHPLGAAGSRVLVTLVHALRGQKKKRGLACVSYGGGGAIAMIVETV